MGVVCVCVCVCVFRGWGGGCYKDMKVVFFTWDGLKEYLKVCNIIQCF